MKTAYLVKVDPDENNNKFYRMTDNGGSGFTVEYGRIGNSNFATKDYSISDWDKKYNEKIRKGYVDQSDLYIVPSSSGSPTELKKYVEISDKAIESIVSKLMSLAKQSIQKNYTVSSTAVTSTMIDRAQEIIIGLNNTSISNIDRFNSLLIDLFTIIPRKMEQVSYYLARNSNDMGNVIKREQDLLDVMRGQVSVQKVEDSFVGEKENQTILEKLGLEITGTDATDKHIILASAGELANKVGNSWKLINKRTQEQYANFVKENNIQKQSLLWHGSRNENWWSIANTGLILHPNSVVTGKMFGYGIYFAPSARKSYGYTSCQGSYWANGNSANGYMGLFDVACGKSYDVYSYSGDIGSMTYDILRRRNPEAHSVYAHAGNMLRNDEIIVYNESQTTIKYLVEFK